MTEFRQLELESHIEAVTLIEALLRRVSYRDWRFSARRGRLEVQVRVPDSHSGRPIDLMHIMPIPSMGVAFIDERTARRWLLERVFDIERHEAMEHFLVDGAAPYFPDHDPDANPYAVTERKEPVPIPPRQEPRFARGGSFRPSEPFRSALERW